MRWGQDELRQGVRFSGVALCEGHVAVAAVDGAAVTSGLLSSNAVTLRLLHDPEKRQLYSATLTVSLATDGPREKLLQNQALLAEFLKEFAPGFKESEVWAADSIRQLIGRYRGPAFGSRRGRL